MTNNNNRLNRKRIAKTAPNLKEEAGKKIFHIELSKIGTKDSLDIKSNITEEDIIRIAAAIAKARIETLIIEDKNRIEEIEKIIHILTNILYHYGNIIKEIMDDN